MASEDSEFRTGFPPSMKAACPDLSQLEERFRCRICYDLYRDPVITKCSHHFCSLCVRKYLLFQSKCPECHLDTFESDLRPDRDLQAILELFLDKILPQIQFKPLKPSSSQPNAPSLTSITSPKSDSREPRMPCPVCGVEVPQRNLNLHVDKCLQPQKSPLLASKKSGVDSPSRQPVLKPIQKVVYHFLKDAELRKRLKEHGLDTKGSRQALISRHQRFSVLWNTNCQAVKPVSKLQIVMQVEREEKVLKQERSGMIRPPQLDYSRNSDQKEIEAKSKDYLKANRGQFSDLINQARANQKRTSVQTHPANSHQPLVRENTDSSDSTDVLIISITPPKSENLENASHNSSLLESMDKMTVNFTQPTGSVGSTLYVTPKRKKSCDLIHDLSPKRLKQKNIESSFKKGGATKLGSNKSKCPVCEQDVPNVHMNAHLDRCLRTTEFTPSEDEFLDSIIDDSEGEISNLAMRTQNSRRTKSRAMLNITRVPSSDDEGSDDFVADEKENAAMAKSPVIGGKKGKGIGKRSTRVRVASKKVS